MFDTNIWKEDPSFCKQANVSLFFAVNIFELIWFCKTGFWIQQWENFLEWILRSLQNYDRSSLSPSIHHNISIILMSCQRKKGSQQRRKAPMTTPSVTNALCSFRADWKFHVKEKVPRLRESESSIFKRNWKSHV